jgi:hypothetical protein
MALPIKLVQGDTLPSVLFYLYDERIDLYGNDTSVPIDLTDVTSVVMHFRQTGLTATTQTISGAIVSAAAGTIRFDWPSDALDGPEGSYEGEIELTVAGGGTYTVYDVQKFKVRKQFA